MTKNHLVREVSRAPDVRMLACIAYMVEPPLLKTGTQVKIYSSSIGLQVVEGDFYNQICEGKK